MNYSMKRVALLLIAAALVFGWLATPAQAVWHTFLDEHFNKDQQNPNLKWPWITDLRNRIGWHWNPRPPHLPHRPSEGDWTDYCWGIQDYIYCTRVRPQDDIQQSLWCAYTNQWLIDQPRWPEDDDYMPRQNAWVWWGPVDLTDAVSAAVSFWIYMDLDNYARDSLSCTAISDPNLLTFGDNPNTRNVNEFFENVPVGKTFSFSRENDWFWNVFYLDSLILAGDDDPENRLSVLGEGEVYIAFIWQSDNVEIAGTGAYIDDVVFSWDDGLFDIVPIESYIGYEINEDSTSWGDVWPDEGDEIQFRVDFKVIGVEETPEFNVNLLVNDEILYSEQLSAMGNDNDIHTIIADTIWTVPYGSHVIRWELDTPVEDGGSVEEGIENNNVIELEFNVIFNPSPEFDILTPEVELDTLHGRIDENLLIEYTISDTLADERFRIFFYWTTDTSDITYDPELIWDVVENYGWIGRDFEAPRGNGRYTWPVVEYTAALDSGTVFWTVGVATDGFPNNNTVSISPGQYIYVPDPFNVVGDEKDAVQPVGFGLTSTFPNPFNDAVCIKYSMQTNGNVKLGIFDLTGRNIAQLVDGNISSGQHDVTWHPKDVSAGVYLVRFEANGKSDFRKVIYMP